MVTAIIDDKEVIETNCDLAPEFDDTKKRFCPPFEEELHSFIGKEQPA